MRAKPLLIGLCYLAIALLNGCGPSYVTPAGVKLKGKVVKGGQPLDIPGHDSATGRIEVILFPADPAQVGQLADTLALAEADGSFLIEYERGVPPGKYKLAVSQRDMITDTDLLKGQFSREKTPIAVDMDKSKIGGMIDLGVIELDAVGKK